MQPHPEDTSSSLDYGRQSVGDGSILLCPRKPYWVVGNDKNQEGVEIRVPANCDSYRCAICGPWKVRQKVRLMVWALARETWIRHWTFTLCPTEWQHCRNQIKDFLFRLREHGKIEGAWAKEQNPKLTGYHIHMMTHGVFLDHWRVQEMWGGRHCWVSPLSTKDVGYVAKMYRLCGYMTKETNMHRHLDLNGGRAVHFTRGFLRGWTSREVQRYLSKNLAWHVEIGKALDTAKEETTMQPMKADTLYIRGDAYEGDQL